jgi:hypothetical protein
LVSRRGWLASFADSGSAGIRLLFDFYPSTLTLLAFAFCRRERWLAAAVALGLAIAHMLMVVPSWRGRRGGAAASEASA